MGAPTQKGGNTAEQKSYRGIISVLVPQGKSLIKELNTNILFNTEGHCKTSHGSLMVSIRSPPPPQKEHKSHAG